MVNEITTKVLNSERDISTKQKVDTQNDDQIRVISTYEADENIVDAVKNCEENLKLTQSFRNLNGPLFTFIKKVGPNLKCHINKLKKQALGTKHGCAVKCGGRGCKTCRMLLPTPFAMVGKRKVKLIQGSCKTSNICYVGLCMICGKPYTGRTVDQMNLRINGHRHCYKEVLKKSAANTLQEEDKNNDMYSLGLHLHGDHGLSDPDAFDKNIKFGILEVVNPCDIDVKEYTWMHNLSSFQPVGINIEYPFGLPFLGQ